MVVDLFNEAFDSGEDASESAVVELELNVGQHYSTGFALDDGSITLKRSRLRSLSSRT